MSELSDFLEEQADLLASNISGWESSTLRRIGKRINKYSRMTLSDVKTINNIAVVKQDMKEIVKELAKVTGWNIAQIKRIYGEALEREHLENEPLYDYRGKTFVPFAENKAMQAIVQEYSRITAETMLNLSMTKTMSVIDRYGREIGLERYYTDILDKAVAQVGSGATNFYTAMRDAIVELGGSGIRNTFESGYKRRIDSSVRQNLLWGAKQASIAYNDMIAEELDCDGYEIDWHSNPRPSHVFMQGKQYCIGETRTINGVRFIGFEEVDPDPTNKEGKSASKALEDYGCLHYKTPIICGVSEPRYDAKELASLNEQNKRTYIINGKEMTGYEASQAMRRLETEIRKQKDIRTLARESGDVLQSRRCTERIKAYKAKYSEISEITGIPEQPKRMSVPRMPKTSDISLTSSGNGGIIEESGAVVSTYINSSDNLFEYAKRIAPIEGFEDQVIHGDKFGFEIRGLDGEVVSKYTPREFADILKDDPNYHGGNIRLISCETGAKDGIVAQSLANILGVDVLAPSDIVIVYPDGSIKIGFDGKGNWILYKKGADI